MLKLPKMAAVFILPFLVMGCFLVLPTEGAALVQMNGLLMEEGAGRFSQKFKVRNTELYLKIVQISTDEKNSILYKAFSKPLIDLHFRNGK